VIGRIVDDPPGLVLVTTGFGGCASSTCWWATRCRASAEAAASPHGGRGRLRCRAVSYLDIACVVILVLALLHGLLKGLFRPLITWAFIIAGVAVGFGRPGVAASFAPSPGWRP